MKIVAVIPARYGSSRFPGKPLALINSKPMIQHVYERVNKVSNLDRVVVATDNAKIYDAVLSFGGEVVMTKDTHESGSDRMAEVSNLIDGDIFLNVQGDEPLIDERLIAEIVEQSKQHSTYVITAKKAIETEEDIENPNVVKVITNQNSEAIYFSRSPIPYNRSDKTITYYKHLGIYCYPKHILQEFVKLSKSQYEEVEMLEQLRLLENGYEMKVLETTYDSVGVDTPEDIKKIENLLEV
ncbi:3-deoxy-manno-octulosonate cytidylyltransferase [Priestia megaterium]|uniref:3-deoxy-manno-octulosonate cytidylyltransferase n=1 Tax=Priestia TaxID=2800373 RepID=UPI000BF8CD00|nr:3-deoxy-manno-octulosonate cytidylyltransferase [Priestia megaterium]MDP1382039.1 3-deoxy-manno-octulosonate cytidylyltransferase [Priestia megaterium]MDP1422723.1 3-deoxy-manno-octulosonate cytidylyltransferase [Priestia megaterium]PFT58442.1 3-deoxy-manno-octulosonate cytidylyltransferase [Priestia megaterium]